MEYTMTLKIELEDVDGKHTSEFVLDDCASWHEAVLRFGNFLASRYGYSITDKIMFVTEYPFGAVCEQYITPNERKIVESNRNRQNDLFNSFESDWGDDE